MDRLTRSLAGRLNELARNLWWTWQPEVIAILRDLDPTLWREANHNPVTFLALLPPDQLARQAQETALESRINQAFRRLEEYLRDRTTWGAVACGVLRTRPVAYFSAEFALHESLPIYSGGLGALAGDHLKGASDLGVPLVGVGIFYGQGYFRQRLDRHGWQQESYGQVDLRRLPLRRAVASDAMPRGSDGVRAQVIIETLPFRRGVAEGTPLTVAIPLGGETLHVGAWIADVGRATLVLLDSDVDDNTPANRALTATLYGGDERLRLRQEMILGIAGLRMLDTLGVSPGVLHLNEGHSAFAPLEMARARADVEGVDFLTAHREAALRTVFTTHTPVPAGHDRFTPDMMLEHFGWLLDEVGIGADELLGLGRVKPRDQSETFCMTVLGLKSARFSNGVSALHGHVTRRMWQNLWPGRPEAEVPIGHITNGVHTPSWLAPSMFNLYERYLGRDWQLHMSEPEVWQRIAAIDDAALWEAHQVQKRRLINFIVRRSQEAAADGTTEGDAYAPSLDGDVLLLCFARRFAEYKRAALLLSDTDRLARLVNATGRPLQIIMAGKAHPRDDNGKRLLQRVVTLAQDPRFHNRLIFVLDYDFNVTRHLVQGTDVWLNVPRRPLEACGTSGQKVLLNGGLNLSVLDGWWVEAYDGENGFAVGNDQTHRDPAQQDAHDAASLYDVLENEVIPLYYTRGSDNVPHGWVARMKHAIVTLAERFNADRMVRDYVRECYLPAVGAASSSMPPPRR